MYTGLGFAPAAIPIAISVGQKLAKIFGGHLDATMKKITGQIATNYQNALNGDSTALEWLFAKSGGHDPVGKSINFNKYTGLGWKPKDIGGDLIVAFTYAGGLRRATYEYYQDAAAKMGQQPMPVGAFQGVRLNNIDTPVYKSTNVAPRLTFVPAPIAPPRTQQAGLFGLDLGNLGTPTLVSLGFLALAFILKDR